MVCKVLSPPVEVPRAAGAKAHPAITGRSWAAPTVQTEDPRTPLRQTELRVLRSNYVGLAYRLQVSELRRHMFHEKLHRPSALLAGCPILARDHQQRAETTRHFIELPELERDRIRIAQEIDASLGELVEGNILARELPV